MITARHGRLLTTTLGGLLLVLGAGIAKGNLLQNGSFEQGPGYYTYLPVGSTAIHGWIVTRNTIDFVPRSVWYPSDGDWSLDLNGLGPGGGGVAQTFPTTPGHRYAVQFDMAANCQAPDPVKHIRVLAAGQSGDFTFDRTGHNFQDMGWTSKTWSFVAADTATTIELYSTDQ